MIAHMSRKPAVKLLLLADNNKTHSSFSSMAYLAGVTKPSGGGASERQIPIPLECLHSTLIASLAQPQMAHYCFLFPEGLPNKQMT